MDLKITVDKKEYEIPELTAGDWRKVVVAHRKFREKHGEDADNLFTEKGIDAAIDFYFALLNPHYPEITRNKLEKMPMRQMTAMFVTKVYLALTEIPLDSASLSESDGPGASAE